MDTLTFTGDFLRKKNNTAGLDVYDPAPSLVEAVNLAILLEQPLLLMGEPGCGKTRLAEAVAAELHKGKYPNHFFRWDIKSTSKAKEGTYQYDALGRLYDANAQDKKAKEIGKYITYGKFAEALTSPQNGDLPNILLIDEIDKADIDFPNDLLLEIEKGEFFIPELNKKIVRKSKTLIFITSNRERDLPPAFLRRCLYHFIQFPSGEDLVKILRAKYPPDGKDTLIDGAVNLFLDVREKVGEAFAENEKKPATSELLDWFRIIHHYSDLARAKGAAKETKALLSEIGSYKRGNLGHQKIPFVQALLKTWESNQLFAG